jgi:hypothetical protein
MAILARGRNVNEWTMSTREQELHCCSLIAASSPQCTLYSPAFKPHLHYPQHLFIAALGLRLHDSKGESMCGSAS